MPSPVCAETFNMANFSGSTCDLLKELLLTNQHLKLFFDWMFDEQASGSCKLSKEFVADIMEMFQPIGTILWAPKDLNLISPAWVKADGGNYLKADYVKLSTLYGTTFGTHADTARFYVPNLSGRFMLCEGQRTLTEEEEAADEATPPSYVTPNQDGHDQSSLINEINEHEHPLAATYPNRGPGAVWTQYQYGDAVAFRYRTPAVTLAAGYSGFVSDFTNNSAYTATGITQADIISHLARKPGTGDKVVSNDPENNMPPYHVGIPYIKANHVFNNQVL